MGGLTRRTWPDPLSPAVAAPVAAWQRNGRSRSFALVSLFALGLAIILAQGQAIAGLLPDGFADGFEVPVAGSVEQGSLVPAPGAILSWGPPAVVSGRFVGFPGDPSPTVTLEVDGAIVPNVTVGPGSFVATMPSPWTEAEHRIVVRVGSPPSVVESRWAFTVRTPPRIEGVRPGFDLVAPGAAVSVAAVFADEGSGIDAGTVSLHIDGVDETTAAAIGEQGLVLPPRVFAAGNHDVLIEVSDMAGNRTVHHSRFAVGLAPILSVIEPPEGSVLDFGATPAIRIGYGGQGVAANPASLRLFIDGEDASASATLVSGPGGGLEIFLPETGSLVAGNHAVFAEIANAEGIRATIEWTFAVEAARDDRIAFVSPEDGWSTEDPQADVVVRVSSAHDMPREVHVNGIKARLLDGAMGEARFAATIPLVDGDNEVVATTRFSNDAQGTARLRVFRDAPVRIAVESPPDLARFGPVDGAPEFPGSATDLTGEVARPIEIRGTLSRACVGVTVNQQAATLSADGRSFSFANYFLREGTNLLSIVATDATSRQSTTHRTVYVDQTAPILVVESPVDGATTSASRIDLRGIANDAVEPGVGMPEVQVVVLTQDPPGRFEAVVADRRFHAIDVPLQVGRNRIEVRAEDALGNRRSQWIEISRIAVGAPRLLDVGGNRQRAPVDTALTRPIEVQRVDAQGNPVPGSPVRFDVVRGSGNIGLTSAGVLGPFGDGIMPERNLVVTTDDEGVARVWWRIGTESGPAANALRVAADGDTESLVFTATGIAGAPSLVLADGAGATQFVQVDSPPVEALAVLVYDEDLNRVIGAPVRFRVVSGDARFDLSSGPGNSGSGEGREIEVTTDKNGLAAVRPFAGPEPGTVQIVAEAMLPGGLTAGRAVFQLIVLARSEGETGFSGIVMDHSGVPLEGVRLSISRTSLSTSTDADGRFRFESAVPAGKIDLHVDGRMATAPEGREYPSLHFETAIVPGRMNQLPHPIYLPPVDRSASRIVGGDEDVVLRIPGYEGFELRVRANSVTFPDGSRVGPLVVSAVHNDRLPMVPPGGGSAFGTLGWTIQPSGTRFDPPAEVSIPSPGGMRAGDTVQIVQWDHDLATFVPMGRGTVSEDGAMIVTDTGGGITKAGWGGCAGPDCPPNPGTPNCGEFNPLGCTLNACMKVDQGAAGQCPACVPKDADEVDNTLMILSPGGTLGPAPVITLETGDNSADRVLFDVVVGNASGQQFFLDAEWFAESETEVQVTSSDALKCLTNTDNQPIEGTSSHAKYRHFYLEATQSPAYFKATSGQYGQFPLTNDTDASVHVTACGLDEVDKEVQVAFKLLNPSRTDISAHIGAIEADTEIQTILFGIACHEPLPRFSQYEDDGLPVLADNRDGGVGMYQITGSGQNNCNTLWDWRANATAGRMVYHGKLGSGIVQNYHLQEPNGHRPIYPNIPLQECLARTGQDWRAIAPSLTEAQKRRAALKFYNGGRQYEWILTPTPAGATEDCALGTWVENPTRVQACQNDSGHSSCNYVNSVLACPSAHP